MGGLKPAAGLFLKGFGSLCDFLSEANRKRFDPLLNEAFREAGATEHVYR